MEFVFIHIGKTAGTSIRAHSDKVISQGHLTAAETKELIGPERYDAAIKFTVIRDPRERFLSACRQVRRDPNDKQFQEEVSYYLSGSYQPPAFRLFLPQWRYLEIDGDISIDKIFRYEEDVPEGVWSWMKEKNIGELRDELPHENKNVHPIPFLDDEAAAFFEQTYREDYQAFSWDKP